MKNKNKVALAMIIKGDPRHAELLDRCLDNFHKQVDGIFITATYKNNKEEAEPVIEVAKKYDAVVDIYQWKDNFAEARNHNFKGVTDDYDWIMWLDADDIVKIKKKDGIRKAVEYADNNNYDSVIAWYLYDFDEFNNCTVKHMKTRIVRNDGSVEWAGALHEDFKANRQTRGVLAENEFEVLHIKDPEDIHESAVRNYEITTNELKKTPDDPRTYWNHGAACLGVGKWKESIKSLKKFVKMSESEEERYIAFQRMALAYTEMGEIDTGMKMTMESIAIKPQYPDAYLQAGNFCHKKEEWDKAREFLVMGLAKPKPKRDIIFFNPRDYDFNPAFKLAHCYTMLGRYKDGLNLIENVCLKMYPEHKQALEFQKELKKQVDKMDKVENIYEKLGKIKDKDKLLNEIQKLDSELRSHPAISYLYNQNFINTNVTNKDISIYCGDTSFSWNPDSLKSGGIGGSEEAVIHMSKLLKERGWNVTVYATMGKEPKEYDGVMWKPTWMFNPRDKFNILIAWRHPLLFDYDIDSKFNIVWLHDVIQHGEFTKKRLEKIDKVFVLSDFHRSLFPNVPDEKIFKTGNGIVKGEFTSQAHQFKTMGNFVWTSSYDRGLKCLLEMWPEIKKRIPNASLDIYYGWELFDMVHKNNEIKKEWKKEVVKMIDDLEPLGVTEHGKVSMKEIKPAYEKAQFWAYPTEFPEIYCITAIKAQAAGAIPITTKVAALEETAKYGNHVVVNDIYTNKNAQELFIKSIVEAHENWGRQNIAEMQEWARNITWDKVADDWTDLFFKKTKKNE